MIQSIIQWIISLFFQQPVKSQLPVITPQPTVAPVSTQPAPPVKTTLDLSRWGLVPELETKAVEFLTTCEGKGYSLRITQGLRTMSQQQSLYNQGRTTPGKIVTNAEPGQSLHNFGKAFDVCFNGAEAYPADDAKWKTIADIGQSIGLTAGYYFQSFKDKPHFQIS